MEKKFSFIVEGPLQAWGAPSAVDVHNCANKPTKRGIVGLFGCCLGYHRDDPRLKEIDNCIKFECRSNEDSMQHRRLRDFQTVRPEAGEVFTKAGGGTTTDGFIKEKYYITDASFTVIITADEEVANVLFDALQDPVWLPFLGRKSCFPSEPLLPKWM